MVHALLVSSLLNPPFSPGYASLSHSPALVEVAAHAAVGTVADNAWRPIHVGAGGWLTGIDIAPDNTMVVRTDTYGAYIWSGTAWQQLVTTASMPAADVAIGHNQGVYEIRIAPSNSSILYMEYLGNVYRSSDKGATWTKTAFTPVKENPNDDYRTNGQKMAVDPHNPDVVYVGTPQNGLFVTADGGVTWNAVSGVPVTDKDDKGGYPGITGIAFDPNSQVSVGKTNVIFASSYGRGVYKSINGGQSWTALTGGPQNVEYAALSNGIYYATGDKNTTLWRYADGSWSVLLSNTSKGLHDVAIDPRDPAHIIVAAGSGALQQSHDGGKTWSGYSGTELSATDIPWLATSGNWMSMGGLAFDQQIDNKLWASAGVGVWNASVPLTATWKTPLVWNSQNIGIEQLVANEILVPPGGHPVLASWDRSFFYVSDPSAFPLTYGMPGQPPIVAGWSLDYASSTPSFVVGIADWWKTENSGYSSDGGRTWHAFSSFPAFAGKAIGGSIAASSPTTIVWAPAGGYAPYYTKDGGANWDQIVLPGVTDWSKFHFGYFLDKTTVSADRVLPNTFYLNYTGPYKDPHNGVYRSTDGGATWTQVHQGAISVPSEFNSQIAAVPGEAGNLFFTGGPQGTATHPAKQGFYRSTDGGASWTAITNVLEVSCFGFGKSAMPGKYPSIYVVGWVNRVYGIWQSNDNAQSWTQIGQWPMSSLDQIKTISGDPNAYGEVYIGFKGSGYAGLLRNAGQ
jgi:photosystem II stability/assembly factor-like uncharacterized protein